MHSVGAQKNKGGVKICQKTSPNSRKQLKDTLVSQWRNFACWQGA